MTDRCGTLHAATTDAPKPSVVIPTLNAAHEIGLLLERLEAQSLKPTEVLIVDSSSDDDTVAIASQFESARITVIDRGNFNHGATRHQALLQTQSDYVCFMTQDAMPVDEGLFEHLMAPLLADSKVALASARQLPKEDARRFEQLVRGFNYPDESNVRDASDRERLGIKAYFASDVCAVYRRSAYLAVGGFETVNTNEDMLMAAQLIAAGYKIAYEASAEVYHSHNFTARQQYERNKAIGQFLREHAEELGGVSVSGEGRCMVKSIIKQLLREGRVGECCAFGIDCVARFAGIHSTNPRGDIT